MSEGAENIGGDLVKYRRRMRGIATFFITISCIGLAGAAIVIALGGSEKYPVEEMFGAGFYAVIMLISGVMAWNGSRLAALILLLLVLSGIFNVITSDGTPAAGELIRTIVYSGLAITMLWSAHKYHKIGRDNDTPIGGSRIIRWGGLAILTPLIAGLGLLLLVAFGQVPTAVVSASEMKQEHFEWLVEQNYLQADERPLFFYSEGLLSIADGGSLLTDKYVGGWQERDGEQVDGWYRLGEICKIELQSEGNALADAVYNVHGTGEDNRLTLILSAEDGGDQRFIRRLKVLNTRNMHSEVKAACDAGTEIDYAALSLAQGIEPGIVAATDIKPDQIRWLQDAEYLSDEETPLQFYSSGVYHIEEGGALLSDLYFGGWYREGGNPQAYWARLGEICSFETIRTNPDKGKTIYKITFGEGGWYQFNLPTQNGEDVALMDQVKAMNEAAKMPEFVATCERNLQKQAENTEE